MRLSPSGRSESQWLCGAFITCSIQLSIKPCCIQTSQTSSSCTEGPFEEEQANPFRGDAGRNLTIIILLKLQACYTVAGAGAAPETVLLCGGEAMYVITVDVDKCEACGDCVDACPNGTYGASVEDAGRSTRCSRAIRTIASAATRASPPKGRRNHHRNSPQTTTRFTHHDEGRLIAAPRCA